MGGFKNSLNPILVKFITFVALFTEDESEEGTVLLSLFWGEDEVLFFEEGTVWLSFWVAAADIGDEMLEEIGGGGGGGGDGGGGDGGGDGGSLRVLDC